MPRLFALLLALALLLPSGSARAAAAPAGLEIPFSYVDGFILVRAQVGTHPEVLTFLVDSGASTAVLSLRTARRLHLPLGETETVRGVGAESVAWHFPEAAITTGVLELSHVELAVDLHNAEALCSRSIDGLIGMEFFAGRVVQIDYAASTLRLLPSGPVAAESILPMKEINGVLCAGVCVNGSQPRWIRVDTGCNDALHWVVPRSAAPRRKGVSIGFITRQRDLVRASVRLGEIGLEGVQISLHGQPLFPGEAGLLGNGLLGNWRVTLDDLRKLLILEKP